MSQKSIKAQVNFIDGSCAEVFFSADSNTTDEELKTMARLEALKDPRYFGKKVLSTILLQIVPASGVVSEFMPDWGNFS